MEVAGTLQFDGDEERYEIWETKFLGHLQSLSLKDAIFGANLSAEIVQFLDDKSLSLIMRQAAENGRKGLGILHGHARKGKPRVISLHTLLTSLKKRTLTKA